MNATEMVVLLDDSGRPIGETPKEAVHTQETPLHLAFSCYLLNDLGELLLTRRSPENQTWQGVWTNSFCGHPAPGEDPKDAVLRRAHYELGVDVGRLELVLPSFRYRAVDPSGIVENELCPVYTARALGPLRPNPLEVADYGMDVSGTPRRSLGEDSCRLQPMAGTAISAARRSSGAEAWATSIHGYDGGTHQH